MHGIAAQTCAACKAKSKFGSTVWITTGGSAFHRKPKCEYLVSGQEKVLSKGGSTDVPESVQVGLAQTKGYHPCLLCYPRPGTKQRKKSRKKSQVAGKSRADKPRVSSQLTAGAVAGANTPRSQAAIGGSSTHSAGVPRSTDPKSSSSSVGESTTKIRVARRARRDGLPAQVRSEHGVELHVTEERFLEGDWTRQGLAPLTCEYCEHRLVVYRRPYQSAGKEYRYWGIVCLDCGTANGLDVYDAETKKAFRSWDKARGT